MLGIFSHYYFWLPEARLLFDSFKITIEGEYVGEIGYIYIVIYIHAYIYLDLHGYHFFSPRLKRLKFLPELDFSPEAVFSARDHNRKIIRIHRIIQHNTCM